MWRPSAAFPDLRQTLQVFVDVPSQSSRKFLPFDFDRRLDRWLHKPPLRPIRNRCSIFAFQALARRRRNASSAGLLHRLRYSTNLSMTDSSTSCGEILLAEQYRMKDESRDRIRLSLSWARSFLPFGG